MSQEKVSSISSSRWYAVQTLSNKEGIVKRYLDKYMASEEMDEYIEEVLMPTETVTEVKSGKKRQKIRKFYPGYLFIHMRLYDDDGKIIERPWYFVKDADGVIGFLGGNQPLPLKESEMNSILSQVQESEGKEVPKVQYELGEEVKITNGPFLNLNGIIEEIDPDRGKLKVSVSIFGRFTPVVLEYWEVERAEDT